MWRTARPVRRSLNAIASGVRWFASSVWDCEAVVSEWTAERMDALVVDGVWMC